MEIVRTIRKYRFWFELLLLAGLVFAFRLYVTMPVENSGDSFVKWYEAKRLAHGLDYSRLDHHTMRWGINFLSLFFQKIFGTQASTYYLPSAFAATLAALFVFLIGTQLQGRTLGIMALLLFCFHPSIIVAGSQLFPGIFSTCYSFGAIYFLLLYTHSTQEKTYYLVISSIFLLCAYGSKMTSLFFLPAFVIYLVWTTRRLRPLVLYLGILFFGVLLETLIIDTIIGDYTMFGRLALAGGHLNIMETGIAGEKSLWGIVTRWHMLPNSTYLPAIVSFFLAFYCINNRNNFPKDFFIALCLISFTFFLTFSLCGVKPIHFLLPHTPRYINITIPLSLLLCLSFSGKLGGKRYIFVAFVLLALPSILALNRELRSPLNRKFYQIDNFQKEVMTYLDKGYAFLFLDPRNARLYRAMFVADRAAMGIETADQVRIYNVPPGATRFNPGPAIYLLTLKKDQITAGIVRPYPGEYRLAVERFTPGNLTLQSNWDLSW